MTTQDKACNSCQTLWVMIRIAACSAGTAADAAAGPRALVVVGPSGVGKGTLIKRLMGGPEAENFAFRLAPTAPYSAGSTDATVIVQLGQPAHALAAAKSENMQQSQNCVTFV